MLVLIQLTLLLSTFHCLLAQSDFTSSPSDTVSIIDGNATLRCSVGNFIQGDLLQWYKDGTGEYISEGTTMLSNFAERAFIEGGGMAYNMGQYDLTIPRLQESDTDTYRCTYRKVGTVDVVGTMPAMLTVLHQPTCSQSPNSAEIGQEVELSCALDSRDVLNTNVVLQVQWNLDGNIISSNPITAYTRRTLSGEDNHEEFVCEVVVTESQNIFRSCSLVPLSITPSASIMPSGTYTIIRGQTVQFVCYPIAYPHIASIDWLINGESIYGYTDIFEFVLSTDRKSFTMTAITDGDENIVYPVNCRVYDPNGYIGDSTSTSIIVEPFVIPTTLLSTTLLPTTATAPVIFVHTPSDTTVTYGSVIVLVCAVNYLGDGAVMKWFKVQEGTFIVVGLEVSITASDDIQRRYSIVGGRDAYDNGQYSLQITNSKDADSGTYFCSYTSTKTTRSFSSAYVEVNVRAPTVAPHTTQTAIQPTTVTMPTYISVATNAPSPMGPVSFKQIPSDTNTTAGSVVMLECAVNYIGDGEMKWFKVESGQYIMVGIHVSISVSEDKKNRYSIVGGIDAYNRGQYSLQINDVKDVDSGTYFCSYTSPDSTSISSTYAKLMLLAALVCQQSPDHALPSGATVTMRCMVDANESTLVLWKDDLGNQLTIATNNSVTYSLVLQPTDNFRAFTCSVVTERAGDFTRTCNLTPLAIRPVVKIIEGNTETSGGMAVNFTCQAEAEPYVSSYEWLIDGNDLATLNETFEFNTDNEIGLLELVPVFNGEDTGTYNITCTVYIPSGQSTTSEVVLLLVTDRGFASRSTDDTTLTVVTLVVIGLLGVILGIVILLLCYVLLCHGRRRKLSLARKISFNQQIVSGGRYGARPSVDNHHIDGFGSPDAIYASPLQIRNGKKQKGLTEKKALNASRQSIYENSAESDQQHTNSIYSEYMNYDHQSTDQENDGVQPVGFPNYGYCPESPTSLHVNISTLPTKPTVAPRPFPKRLSSFEPLPDVCNSKLNDYFDPINTTLENEENHIINEMQPDELIYSNEPVRHSKTNSHHYDDFDTDSFDSDSEDETHM